jgi:predicted Zn-dependent protease
LRAGDEVVAVQGTEIGAQPKRGRAYERLGRVEELVEQGLRAGGLTIRARRSGAGFDAVLPPTAGCASRFQLLTGAGLNAKADGSYVQVSGAMVEFASTDDELALVIAHELAHNVLGHRARLDAAGVSRGLLAGFGKNRGRIRETELEADRLALYLMARAGYDPGIAPDFWQRFGRKLVPGFLSDGTHPGVSERVRRAEAEIARIKAQQAAGQQPTP